MIMVVVAVAIGVILLVNGGAVGFDQDDTSVDIGSDSGDGATTEETTTTTEAPPSTVAPASVVVVAANGANVSGLAGRTTDVLAALGYSNTQAKDATADAAVTAIYFAPGFDANAAAIAQSLGFPTTAVQALPAQPVATDQPADAGVVVLLGADSEALIAAAEAVTTTTAPAGGAGSTTTTTA